MKNLGTNTLETERLILRKFTLEDAQPMYDNWVNDYEVIKYLTWPKHNSVDDTKIVLGDWIT
ncbi:GNAT family N-acetyltransferase [Clostridium sp. LP20]|uniref:GNAT family N-acetyltransferase n=1 Tax=Clostridium sp. LP20 TaxID=3418665 RepID=UPI003EE6EF7E